MEFCEGGASETIDLKELIQKYIKDNKDFSEKEVMEFCVQMAQALQYIYLNKIIHRDLKPANIFIKGEQYILGDFGITKVGENAKTLIGTPYYVSPELLNELKYDARTDIWALGCILYELCTL